MEEEYDDHESVLIYPRNIEPRSVVKMNLLQRNLRLFETRLFYEYNELKRDGTFDTHLKVLFWNKLGHVYKFIANFKLDMRDHAKKIETAMARDAGENWTMMTHNFYEEIEEHINNKIRSRAKRRATRPTISREFDSWVDFHHFLKLYKYKIKWHTFRIMRKGCFYVQRVLESFTDINFPHRPWCYDTSFVLKMESLYSKKTGFINKMIWLWYKNKVPIIYHKICQRDLFFIPKPRLSQRCTNLVYFAMKKIIEMEEKLLLESA